MENKNSCVVQKKFLFWKWNVVEHDYQIWCVTKFMFCSEDFIVKRKCSKCGNVIEQSFVENDELLKLGYSQNTLNSVSDSHPCWDAQPK